MESLKLEVRSSMSAQKVGKFEVRSRKQSARSVMPRRSDFRLHTSDLLLSYRQPLDEIRVPLRVLRLEVIQQAAPLADEHQESAARMVILRVRFEVLCQVVDA